MSHAGVSSSDLRYYTINAEYDDGIRIYDISFASGDYEYDYDINVATGAVLQSEKDYDDDYARMNRASAATGQSTNVQSANPQSTNPSAASTPEPVQPEPVQQAPAQNTRDSYIGEARAKEIAFSHAGVSSGNVSGVSVEFDMERGGKYEVDFRSGGYEYSYEINAQTGSVIDYEKEYDD